MSWKGERDNVLKRNAALVGFYKIEICLLQTIALNLECYTYFLLLTVYNQGCS